MRVSKTEAVGFSVKTFYLDSQFISEEIKSLKLKKNTWKWILLSALLVGTLDIGAALLHFYIKTGKDPLLVPKYIASAVFGDTAYSGKNMVLYGFLFHYFIALCWTVLFFLLYPKIHWLWENRLLTGIIYGIAIWLVMTRIIVPLSKASTGAFDIKQAVIGILILVVAIGIPLSLLAFRHCHKNASS